MSVFPYLGSMTESFGRVDLNVEMRITLAIKTFGALCKSVFMDKDFTVQTMKMVYNLCVLCWYYSMLQIAGSLSGSTAKI